MLQNIINAVGNFFLAFCMAYLIVYGADNLDEFTGHVLIRITFPIVFVVLIIATWRVFSHKEDKED